MNTQDEKTDSRIRRGIRHNPVTSDRNPTTSDRILSESVGILCTGFRQSESIGSDSRKTSESAGSDRNSIPTLDIRTCATNPVYPHNDDKCSVQHAVKSNKCLFQ